jgi:GH18 family chitinase
VAILELTTNSKRLAGYFPAGASALHYHVTDIPANRLTHVIYAFAGISATGECVSESPADDRVNFPELLQLKQQHPQLMTLISIGGASSAARYTSATSSPAGITTLAQSGVKYMKDNGFDGIDIDWEFPTSEQKEIYTALLVELRHQLDTQGSTDGRSYLLTIAAPAGPSNYNNIDLAQIHSQLDWINLETYDFTVVSSHTTNFVAPLFPAKADPAPPTHNVDAAVKAYLAAGVPADKVVVGVRFIGNGWQGVPNINNGLYQSNTGPAKGTWDKAGSAPSGSIFYQDIEENYIGSYSKFWEPDAKVPWLYNPATGIMISYEDPRSVGDKANYVVANNLGGAMVWELAADDRQHSLLDTIAGKFDLLESTPPNLLPRQLASQAESIVNDLEQTDYQHTDNIDVDLGIYDCDCNGFVSFVMERAAPDHYAKIPKEADQPRPRAFEYYDFFNSLTPESAGGWHRIDFLRDARRGDIIAWRFPKIEPGHDTGHVLFVAETPVADDSGVFSVRVYDSAAEPHFEDSRGDGEGEFESGVGSGFINFTVDDLGRPEAFQFAPSEGFTTLPIAIGRCEPVA